MCYHRYTHRRKRNSSAALKSSNYKRTKEERKKKRRPTPPPKKQQQRIHPVGLYTWGRWRRGEPQGWGRPGRLDTDSTSSHLSGLPSRGAALCFGGGGGGLMHRLRPLISSFGSTSASWKVPETCSLSCSKDKRVSMIS